MLRINIIMIGSDDFTLNVGTNTAPKAEELNPEIGIKDTVIVETVETRSELPSSGRKVDIDADVLQALIAMAKGKSETSIDSKLATAIDKLAEATAESNDTMDRRFLGSRPIESVQIDKDDLLPVPAVFFAHSVSFAIYDDKKAGFTIKPPYNRSFKFRNIERIVDKSSTRNPTYVSLSALMVRSKKEAEWLRNHSLLGIKFFEKKEGGKDISFELQDKIVKAYSMVSAIDDHTVMQRCINEGISVDTPDMSILRKRLAFKIAGNMVKDEDRIRKNPVQDYENVIMNKVPVEGERQSTSNAMQTY